MEYYNNKEKIKKLKNIKDYVVIIDFDKTLTTSYSDSSVGTIPNFLGGECLEKRTKNFQYYRPIELDYNLSKQEKQKLMKEWAEKSFSLISEYATEDVVKETAKVANLNLRKGAKEFLYKMKQNSIPVVIMSAGVGNIIKEFLQNEQILYDNITIVSNFFEFKNNKACISIEKIMSTSNKEYSRIPKELRNEIEECNKVLLFGDIVEDIRMINKEQLHKTLTIGFLDYNIEKNLKKYNENFDVVLSNESSFELIIKKFI
ncbi:MAG: hypothetical protein E7310_01535 [Clostridiales bacterium]|nr:hypothetical protein [Clostridiales bacterium]